MLIATLASGTTVITNAAKEPEIEDLQKCLNACGAKISGAGTSIIQIEGVKRLGDVEHKVIPDRIVASTYLSAAAAAGGKISVNGIVPKHIEAVTDILKSVGCDIAVKDNSLTLESKGRLTSAQHVITRPYPGFPTDAQPPVMAACLKAEGTTIFVETIFNDRFRHAGELMRMGADIRTEGRIAIVKGVKKLHSAPVAATDLRGGAALVVAALAAEGVTEISGLWHIDRGYDQLENTLCQLGADIKRIG
jgi:UDP-N-acetylglucosamine 1-carboxyvinyltransferase